MPLQLFQSWGVKIEDKKVYKKCTKYASMQRIDNNNLARCVTETLDTKINAQCSMFDEQTHLFSPEPSSPSN